MLRSCKCGDALGSHDCASSEMQLFATIMHTSGL